MEDERPIMGLVTGGRRPAEKPPREAWVPREAKLAVLGAVALGVGVATSGFRKLMVGSSNLFEFVGVVVVFPGLGVGGVDQFAQ